MQKTEHHLLADTNSSRHFPAAPGLQLPGETWILYSVAATEAFRKLSWQWPLAGTRPSASWWQLSYGCCVQRLKPESQNGCQGWALDWCHLSGNRSILFGIAQTPMHLSQLCLSSWAKGHRHSVTSWASLWVLSPSQSKFLYFSPHLFSRIWTSWE